MRRSLFIVLSMAVVASLSYGQAEAPKKAQIVLPKSGATLTGRVDVEVKLPENMDGPVYAGIGGPPWVQLECLDDDGVYEGVINSKMVPNGGHNLIVKTTNKRADTASSVKVSNPLKVYFSVPVTGSMSEAGVPACLTTSSSSAADWMNRTRS